jgi:hypothetical protein
MLRPKNGQIGGLRKWPLIKYPTGKYFKDFQDRKHDLIFLNTFPSTHICNSSTTIMLDREIRDNTLQYDIYL